MNSRLLLDTHILLWWLQGSKKLPPDAKAVLERPGTEIFITAVSIWEVSIKAAAGRLSLTVSLEEEVERLFDGGATALPVQFEHAYAVRHLPPHHSDPFDRLIVAQAQCEGLTLVTSDVALRAYGVPILDASA